MASSDMRWRFWFEIAVLVAMALVLCPLDLTAQGGWLDPARVGWREASYHGRKLIFSLDATVALGFPGADEIAEDLEISREVDALEPSPERTVAVRLESEALGSESKTLLFADACDGTALQRREIKTKRNGVRYKTLRFAADGFEIRFHDPAPGQDLEAPRSWSRLKTRFAPYPAWAGEDLDVSEPTALFYILSAAPLSETGDVVRFPAVSKDRLVELRLEVAGWEQLQVDYERDGRPIEGPVPALKILVTARDLDPASDESPLEMLGLHGAIEVHLDAETRAPLAISGKVPFVGRARVRIQSLTSR